MCIRDRFKTGVPNAQADGNHTKVLIGTSLDETLVNLRSAIILNTTDAANNIRNALSTDASNTYSTSLILNDNDNSREIIFQQIVKRLENALGTNIKDSIVFKFFFTIFQFG